MTAPSSGGTYREDWKFINPSGTTIPVSGSNTIWVIINVPTVLTDGATFQFETIPDNTKIGAGQAFTKSWTIRNSGTTTWNNGYRLRWVSGANLSNHVDVVIAGTVAFDGSCALRDLLTSPTRRSTDREDWKFINPSGTTIPVSGSNTIW